MIDVLLAIASLTIIPILTCCLDIFIVYLLMYVCNKARSLGWMIIYCALGVIVMFAISAGAIVFEFMALLTILQRHRILTTGLTMVLYLCILSMSAKSKSSKSIAALAISWFVLVIVQAILWKNVPDGHITIMVSCAIAFVLGAIVLFFTNRPRKNINSTMANSAITDKSLQLPRSTSIKGGYYHD